MTQTAVHHCCGVVAADGAVDGAIVANGCLIGNDYLCQVCALPVRQWNWDDVVATPSMDVLMTNLLVTPILVEDVRVTISKWLHGDRSCLTICTYFQMEIRN